MSDMSDDQRRRLESASRIGKSVHFRHKGGNHAYAMMGVVEDEVYVLVDDYKHMIQRIRFADGMAWGGNTHAYRIGYYTYDATRTRIVWGQYTSFVTETELCELLAKARAKGWLALP